MFSRPIETYHGDSLAKRFRRSAEGYPNATSQLSRNAAGDFEPVRYREMYQTVKRLAFRLRELGVRQGTHIGLISDNRKEWLLADLATICLGAVDVPRGSDSTSDELGYILDHADCTIAFVEDQQQIDKVISQKKRLPNLELLLCFDAEGRGNSSDLLRVLPFDGLIGRDLTEQEDAAIEREIDKQTADDLVTIIYTSGTTGEPKGVMLTNRNYLFQLDRICEHLNIAPGDRYLSVLPAWHSFERAVEYVAINVGATIAYSKPVGPVLRADIAEVKPQWTAAVPRLWEAIRAGVYRNVNDGGGVKKALFIFFVSVGGVHAKLKNMVRGQLPRVNKRIGVVDFLVAIGPFLCLFPLAALGRILVFRKLKKRVFGSEFIGAISGGGALPPQVDRFFQAVGILLLEGYGLTETGPIISVRMQRRPVAGTVGRLLRDVEAKVVDQEMQVLPPGKKGVLFIKSEQVMRGYYKRKDATAAVLKDGWLNTGDIVILTRRRRLKIIGRAKETIVLLGGENVEPAPIEDRIRRSEAIDQVMIVGQDQKFLAALVVVNMEHVADLADKSTLGYVDTQDLLNRSEIQEYLHDEIRRLINTKTGFKPFELIFRCKLLAEPFKVGDELTHTLKVRRNVVAEKYSAEVKTLFA